MSTAITANDAWGACAPGQSCSAISRNRPLLVRDVMVRLPKTLSAHASVTEARASFTSDHVHLLLVVDHGRLVSTIERDDLELELSEDLPARRLGHLQGRVVVSETPLADAKEILETTGKRRLAVIDDQGALIGLLCLKRTRQGFCDDNDVQARAGEANGPAPGAAAC